MQISVNTHTSELAPEPLRGMWRPTVASIRDEGGSVQSSLFRTRHSLGCETAQRVLV